MHFVCFSFVLLLLLISTGCVIGWRDVDFSEDPVG